MSRGDSGLADNDGANPREESDNHDNQPVRSSSSAIQRNSGKSASQDRDDPLSPSAVHGSTPLSQIGAHGCAPVNDMYLGQGESDPPGICPFHFIRFVRRRSSITVLTQSKANRVGQIAICSLLSSSLFFFSPRDKPITYFFYSESG